MSYIPNTQQSYLLHICCHIIILYIRISCFLGPPSGAASWNDPLLLRPADRRRLRGPAGGGFPPRHPSAGLGLGCVLPPGPPPSAGPLLHSLQPRRVQEPASHSAPRPGHRLLRRQRRSRWKREREGLGVRRSLEDREKENTDLG